MNSIRQWLVNAFGTGPAEAAGQADTGDQATNILNVRTPSAGEVLGERYRLDQLIALGGMAAVYRGYDLELDHLVAVKVLLTNPDGNTRTGPELRQHLRREALAAMRLNHPLIARIYTYERRDPWEYLVMEFVPGRNLGAVAKLHEDGRLGVRETILIGLDVLEALAYAHGQGVIHNDITPNNILVDIHNTVKVCDFGLSRLVDLQAGRNRVSISGTAAYMSPERIQGWGTDARSDLYALGATLYAVSCGTPPFGLRTAEALRGHTRDRPPPCGRIPSPLATVLHKALEKDPEARFTDAGEMADALSELLDEPRRAPETTPSGALTAIHQATAVTEGLARTESLDPDDDPREDAGTRATPPPGMAWIPPRQVTVDGNRYTVEGFLMDLTPVTNAQYARFVEAEQQLPPAWWPGRQPPRDKRDHPVVGITVAQARRYAAWQGKRLPTTLEWISVVQGEEGRPLPWGKRCDPSRCQCPRGNPGRTAPVNAHPAGASPEGCIDLLGNVWEWTEVDPRLSPPEPDSLYVMGGSFRHHCQAEEGILPRTTVGQHGEYLYLGFRCAMDPGERP